MISDYLQMCNLEQLTRIDNYKWVARCPVCGDSEKSRSKKRFYILVKKEQIFCHNCSYNNSIYNFIKERYPEVFKEYVHDIIKLTREQKRKKFWNELKDIKKNSEENSINIPDRISLAEKYGLEKDLTNIRFALSYIQSRNLDPKRFWFIDNYLGLSRELKTGEFTEGYDPRVVIPFIINSTGELYAMQGRALLPDSGVKYLTILFDESKGKIYNYYNVDWNKRVYVTEGPIDSMFLDNSISLSGASINQELINKLKSLDHIVIMDTDFVYNKDVRRTMNQCINKGLTVFIPPKNIIDNFKDINDLSVKLKMNNEEILELINNNSYSGIKAKVILSKYKMNCDII